RLGELRGSEESRAGLAEQMIEGSDSSARSRWRVREDDVDGVYGQLTEKRLGGAVLWTNHPHGFCEAECRLQHPVHHGLWEDVRDPNHQTKRLATCPSLDRVQELPAE